MGVTDIWPRQLVVVHMRCRSSERAGWATDMCQVSIADRAGQEGHRAHALAEPGVSAIRHAPASRWGSRGTWSGSRRSRWRRCRRRGAGACRPAWPCPRGSWGSSRPGGEETRLWHGVMQGRGRVGSVLHRRTAMSASSNEEEEGTGRGGGLACGGHGIAWGKASCEGGGGAKKAEGSLVPKGMLHHHEK